MNKNATLVYINSNSFVNLENSNLYNIDNITKNYNSEKEIIEDPKYAKIIESFKQKHEEAGQIKLYYLNSNIFKEELKLLFKDHPEINIKKHIGEDLLTEFENARKKLWSSKNKLFLRMFLKNDRLIDTTYFNVKITNVYEYKILRSLNIPINEYNNSFYISFNDLLLMVRNTKKIGKIRLLYEAGLEAWKRNIEENIDLDEQYYYGRELNLLEIKYQDIVRNYKQRIRIRNLKSFSIKYIKRDIKLIKWK